MAALRPLFRPGRADLDGYVHKFRLESQEGAAVDIDVTPPARDVHLGRLLVKTVAAVALLSATLVLSAKVWS